MKRLNKIIALTLASLGLLAGNTPAAISVGTVGVGDIGNANDATGFGAVSYAYSISTFEVTLSQYTSFLNAVAKTDTYGLYNANIGSDRNVRGITRSGAAGSYTYALSGTGTRPVSYVGWFDAARFVNWMQNGQPVGLQAAGTTETGTYTLNGAQIGNTFTRNAGASYALPSENEWYKAAYYQPAAQGGDADNYWLYPTANNSIPNSMNGSLTDPNSANFLYDDLIVNGMNGGYAVTQSPAYVTTANYLTSVGAFTLADSFYGTFDQGGNLREWTEGVNGPNNRIVRGGAWNAGDAFMTALNRSATLPLSEVESIGFRIVIVPEPTVGVMLGLGIALLAWKRKRAV